MERKLLQTIKQSKFLILKIFPK